MFIDSVTAALEINQFPHIFPPVPEESPHAAWFSKVRPTYGNTGSPTYGNTTSHPYGNSVSPSVAQVNYVTFVVV